MDTPTPDNAASATPVAWMKKLVHRSGTSSVTRFFISREDATKYRVYGYKQESPPIPLVPAATVTALEAEVERLREDAYKFRRIAQLLDGFDFRLGRNVLMPPATYLDSVEITCEFQPGVGQTVIDAIMDTLTGAGAK